MNNGLKLKNRIMRRVYAIWVFKRVLPYVAVESAGFAAMVYYFSKLVYVRSVIDNAIAAFFSNPQTWLFYEMSSFLNKGLAVQLLFLGSLALILFAARNVFKAAVQYAVLKEETGLTY